MLLDKFCRTVYIHIYIYRLFSHCFDYERNLMQQFPFFCLQNMTDVENVVAQLKLTPKGKLKYGGEWDAADLLNQSTSLYITPFHMKNNSKLIYNSNKAEKLSNDYEVWLVYYFYVLCLSVANRSVCIKQYILCSKLYAVSNVDNFNINYFFYIYIYT